MPERENAENARILLGLLESVERDGTRSQRGLASELGIALGLVNVYIKRCVKKGLLKVSTAPAHRYVYYLTPQGFAEKSRLTVEYLSYSFGFFRAAKSDCAAVFEAAQGRGWKRVVLAGASDLAEIATLSAAQSDVEIAAVVDGREAPPHMISFPVLRDFDELDGACDGVIVTDLESTRDTYLAAIERYGAERVLVPAILHKRLTTWNGAGEEAS